MDDWLVRARFAIPAVVHLVYNDVHCGDHLSSDVSAELLKEVEEANRFPNHRDVSDGEFFAGLRRLCEASIATRNPIVF